MSQHKYNYSLSYLAGVLNAHVHGDAECCVTGIADLATASSSDLSFLASSKYKKLLSTTSAGAVILQEQECDGFAGNALFVRDPYFAYAQVSALFSQRHLREKHIHPSATVDPSAVLGDDVAIGANCVIGANVTIGDGCELYPNVFVDDNVSVGARGLIYANVCLYHGVQIGSDVTIHSNTTIGSDGFGFAPHKISSEQQGWQKIHQLGAVIVGNYVEIGANTAIDRGALDNTIIDDYVIIDNQVHIAHNVHIGAGTAIAGCVGMAGSTRLGKNCIVAGACSINGHLDIAANTHFSGATVVTRGNSESGAFASAGPLQDVKSWRKNAVRYRQLDELFARVKKLESAQNNKPDS